MWWTVVVERPRDVETTALGAAMLAGLGCGLYENLDEVTGTWALQQRFTPQMSASRRARQREGYARAVQRALGA